MSIQTTSALETEIIQFLENSRERRGLREIVKKFRPVADDASIKAALLKLNGEGLLEITPDWQFCISGDLQ